MAEPTERQALSVNGKDAPVNHMHDLVPDTPFADRADPDHEFPDCSVIRLMSLLGRLRVFPLKPQVTSSWLGGCTHRLVTHCFNFYFFLVLCHSMLWVVEVLLGFVNVMKDSSLNNMKNVLFNSRYGFMVFKSTFLLICLRLRSDNIVGLSKEVALEFGKCRHKSRIIVKRLTAGMLTVLLLLSFLWELLDWMQWGLGFTETWLQDIEILVLNRTIKQYQILSVWYSFGSPVNILMNIAMLFYAVVIMSLYFSWRELNQRLKYDLAYLLNDFEDDWERLRQLAERADDHFSVAVFIGWGADIVCAVGYLGSVVIYGGGKPLEQTYTVIAFLIHAIWNPGCYLVPCILFDEEMIRTRQIVMGAVHEDMKHQRKTGKKDQERMLHLNLILQTVAYRPIAFTAWKFFYITRNVILTISTVLVSYALVLVQLVGPRKDPHSALGASTDTLTDTSGSQLNLSATFPT